MRFLQQQQNNTEMPELNNIPIYLFTVNTDVGYIFLHHLKHAVYTSTRAKIEAWCYLYFTQSSTRLQNEVFLKSFDTIQLQLSLN